MTLDRQERRFTGGRERRQFIDQLQGSLEPTAHLLPPGRITKDSQSKPRRSVINCTIVPLPTANLSSGLFTIGNNLHHMHVYSETKNYSDFFVDWNRESLAFTNFSVGGGRFIAILGARWMGFVGDTSMCLVTGSASSARRLSMSAWSKAKYSYS